MKKRMQKMNQAIKKGEMQKHNSAFVDEHKFFTN